MSKRFLDLIEKYPQYEHIPYAGDLECPECGKTGFFDYNNGHKHSKPKLIGWCETNIGKMAIFECTCGQKYRFHCTISTWTADYDEFEYYLYTYAQKCSNWPELEVLIEENDIK